MNNTRHGNKLSSEEQILKRIDWEVRTHIMGSRKFVRRLPSRTYADDGECQRRCLTSMLGRC
jgi:hypothetical protein